MNPLEGMKVAIGSLVANKLRSALTALGIIIGVAAVIALLSIGRGAQVAITAQIQSIGTNLIFVRPGSTTEGGVRSAAGSATTLTLEDAEALADPLNAPSVALIAPETTTWGQLVYLGNNVNTRITGVTPEYEVVRNTQLQAGAFITALQVTGRSRVVILGSAVAASLFEELDPIGQWIKINRIPFQVIGLLQSKGGSGFGNQDDIALVPLTTAQSRLSGRSFFRGQRRVSVINVQAVDESQVEVAMQQVADILRQRHQVMFEDDFTISSQKEFLETITQVTNAFTFFLGGVAAISLIVGGIGIMNIMLVSVTERTREIGIRKAVGANRWDILIQFLIEAVFFSVTGGGVGILLGTGAARLLSGLNLGQATIQAVVSLDSILLATIFSVAVGVLFGIYPANRAAGLNPIDALRYE